MIEQPTDEQLRAIERLNYIADKEARDQSGQATFYPFGREVSQALLRAGRRSIERSFRDAGMENQEWQEDLKDLLAGKIPLPESSDPNICPGGHNLRPVFREKSRGLLLKKCTICTPVYIRWENEL